MADTKNPGPLLVSYGVGDINALPVEWRALMGFRQEDQQMPLGYVLSTNGGPDLGPPDISENRLMQTRTDERKRTSVTLNPPPSNGGVIPPGGGPPDSWMLVAEERLPWGQVATRTRAFVPLGSHLVLNDNMLQAEQRNLGIGLDQVVLTAPLPGPGIVDTKFDDTASLVSTTKTRKLISAIADGETIIGSVWRQVTHESETATVASEVVVSRTLPGPTLPSTRFDNNSVLVTINKTKKLTSLINEGETVTPTSWLKTYGDGETGLISTEIVESRALPGPAIISSRFDTDNTLVTIIKTQKKADQFTDGETIQGSTWTRTTREGLTGLVATEVKEARTVPGPTIIGFRLDNDGAVVTVAKTKKLIGNINEGEVVTPTQWVRTYSTEENLLIATEVVETRDLGVAAPSVVTTHYDNDNTLVTVTKTKKKTNQFTDGEDYNSTTHVWTRTTREGVSEQVATEVIESRVLPGQPVTSYELDEDGATVTVVRTKKLLDNIAYGETADTNTWTRTTAEGETLLFATEVVKTRSLGGPAVTSFRIDNDGAIVTLVKRKRLTTLIVEGETVSSTVWTKTYAEQVTAKVSNEVVETRALGVNAPIVESARIDPDGLIVNVSKVKKQETTITPSNIVAADGTWTKVYKEAVDGLVATEVTEVAHLGQVPSIAKSETKLDDDGFVVTITRTRKRLQDLAASGETLSGGTWTKTTREQVDGPVWTEIVQTRAIPGGPVRTTRLDPDGLAVEIIKTKEDKANVTAVEAIITGNVWTKTYGDGEDQLISTKVVEKRLLGQAPVVTSHRLERDGLEIQVAKQRVAFSVNLNPREVATDALWTRVYFEEVDGLVVTQVTETAVLPGPVVTSTRLEDDGRASTITKQRRHTTDTVNSEILDGIFWTKSYKEGDSGVLATQVIEKRNVQGVPANTVPSAHVDQDFNVTTITRATKAKTAITPGVVNAGGNITTTEQKEVSDLVSEEIKSVTPTLDKAKYSVAIENPLPQQFRSLGVIREETHILAGQAVVPSGLLAGELERSQEQVNAVQRRTLLRTIDTASLPVAYAGKELSTEYGGVYLITEKKIALNNDATVDIVASDALIPTLVRAKIERFGSFKVRDKATVSSGFPVLSGGTVDPAIPFVSNFTEQVVDPAAAGTKASIGAGTMTEIKPLDAARSLKRITTIKADNLAGSIQKFKMSFPGTTDISVPPQLMSVEGIDAGTGGGSGAYSQSGSYTIVNNGNGQLSIRAEANSNASSQMDAIPIVKQLWGQNVKCSHWLFFILGPTVTYATVLSRLASADIANQIVNAWPRFNPQSVNLTFVGSRVSSHAQMDRWFSDSFVADYLGRPTRGGAGRSAGAGTSQLTDFSVRTMTIPPTIHGALNISNHTQSSVGYGANATLTLGGSQTATAISTAGAQIKGYQIAATPGQTTIPATGKFLHRMSVEPWKFNYFKVDCEVVDFGDL